MLNDTSRPPWLYDYANTANACVNPSTVHVSGTGLAHYFKRYLFQRAISAYKFTLPKTWAANYFLYTLFGWGFIAIVDTDKFGVIPQACGLRGYNVFYQPTNAVITNPLLTGILEPRIGKECALIKLQPTYSGIMDLVDYYGDMMALCAETTGTNLLNSKLSYVFTAKNKAAAESLKKMFDRIASGEPMVVQDKQLLTDEGEAAWQTFSQNVGQNFIAPELLDTMRAIQNQYDSEIGIPNANTSKRERLITDEANANNVETYALVDLWYQYISESLAEAREMFGIPESELNIAWRFPRNLEGGISDAGNDEPSGAV